jgi:hypothetical protein
MKPHTPAKLRKDVAYYCRECEIALQFRVNVPTSPFVVLGDSCMYLGIWDKVV